MTAARIETMTCAENAGWAGDVRAWANMETLGIHDAACRVAARRGNAEAVRAAARAALEVDRCHEPAYRALIWAHACRGERSAVDYWFRQCRRNLRSELDLHPDPLTIGLHTRAMNRDDALACPLS
ncbi:BTAD domain-containing putative transcriptional regulator [Pseudonocardia alni]|uniref:BTAD domain-containing putative transcriptional regulator n=1 Tax=Pseudonocardia alni TaxID=33907 RepID=UPI0035714935